MLPVCRWIFFFAALTSCVGRAQAKSKSFNLQAVWLLDPTATYLELFKVEMKEVILELMRKLRSLHPNSSFGMARPTGNDLPCSTTIQPLTPNLTVFENHVTTLPMFRTTPYDSIPFPAISTCLRDASMGWNQDTSSTSRKVILYTSLVDLKADSDSYKTTACGQQYDRERTSLNPEEWANTFVVAIVPYFQKRRWQKEFTVLNLPHHVVTLDPAKPASEFYDHVASVLDKQLSVPTERLPTSLPVNIRQLREALPWWAYTPLGILIWAFMNPGS